MNKKKIFTKFFGLFSCFSTFFIVACNKDNDSDPVSYLQNCIDKNFNGKSNNASKINDIVMKNFKEQDPPVIYSDRNNTVNLDKFSTNNITSVNYDKNDPSSLVFSHNYISKDNIAYFFLVKFKLIDLQTTFFLPLAIIFEDNIKSIDLSKDSSYTVATIKVGSEDNPLMDVKFPFKIGICLPDNWYNLLI